MSQSTVSQRLQNLEAEIGAALVVRGRDVRLTPAGQALLPRAKALLAAEVRVRAAALPFVEQIAGPVHISASQTSGGYILPPLLCAFQDEHPDVSIHLHIENSEDVLRTVADGEADFGVVESPDRHARVTEYNWVEDPLFLVAAPGHPALVSDPLTRHDLAGSLLAIREPGSGTRSTLSLAWPVPLERDFRLLEMGSQAAVRACVATGRAVAFLSRWVVSEDVTAGRLVLRQVADVDPKRTMRLVKRREAFPSKATSELFDALRKASGRLLPVEDPPSAT